MRRRIIGLTLCLIFIATAAFAVDIPTKQIYCRALKRLADAAGQGKRLEWTVSLSPQNMDTVSAGAQAVIAALTAEGYVFADESGGQASAALTLGGTELLRAQSVAGEGWRTFSLGERTYLAAEDSLAQAEDALGLGALGALLFSLDYDWVSQAQTPYVTPVSDAGLRRTRRTAIVSAPAPARRAMRSFTRSTRRDCAKSRARSPTRMRGRRFSCLASAGRSRRRFSPRCAISRRTRRSPARSKPP